MTCDGFTAGKVLRCNIRVLADGHLQSTVTCCLQFRHVCTNYQTTGRRFPDDSILLSRDLYNHNHTSTPGSRYRIFGVLCIHWGRPRKGWKEEVVRDLQVVGVRRWRELVADRKKMEGHCSTGQSPQRAVVPMEEEIQFENELLTDIPNSRDVTTKW